jgi:hypothetical protein
MKADSGKVPVEFHGVEPWVSQRRQVMIPGGSWDREETCSDECGVKVGD